MWGADSPLWGGGRLPYKKGGEISVEALKGTNLGVA